MPRQLIAAAMILIAGALGALADDKGPVILRIVSDDGSEFSFDRGDLDALPQQEFRTSTIWTDGPQDFGGVRLADLMESIDETAERVILTAANGYQVERAASDLQLEGALLAYRRNGSPMSLRDKGPIWLVYDYDSDPAYRTEVTYANSIWQLDRIELAH